jgi:hypothetical protein
MKNESAVAAGLWRTRNAEVRRLKTEVRGRKSAASHISTKGAKRKPEL